MLAALVGPAAFAQGPEPRAVAQLAYEVGGRVNLLGADGADRLQLVPPTSARSTDLEPAWSPDGTRLAVVHERNGQDDSERSRIDVLDADGSNRRRITRLAAGVWVSAPRWSPDGRRLAFARFVLRSGRYRSAIVIRDVVGGGTEAELVSERLDRRLTSVGQPAWSPDGQRIVYTRTRLGRRAYFRSSLRELIIARGEGRVFLRDAHSAEFSPDGTQIVFVGIGDENGTACGSDECAYNGELYVAKSDGSSPRRLTRNKGDDAAPSWASDGTKIAFSSNRNYPAGYGHELYSVEPDGGCLTWLTNGTATNTEPAWRPGAGSTDAGGCGATPRRALVETDLGPLSRFDIARPLWLGTSYRGLLLSDVDDQPREPLFLGYLDCGRYHPRDCPPGLQLLISPVCARDSHVPFLGTNREDISGYRGALVSDYGFDGGVSVLTGGMDIHIAPETARARPARRAVRALRPFPHEPWTDGSFAPPVIPRELARQVRDVERAQRRLGSSMAIAERLGLSRSTVRRRLANGRALREFGKRVRTVRC